MWRRQKWVMWMVGSLLSALLVGGMVLAQEMEPAEAEPEPWLESLESEPGVAPSAAPVPAGQAQYRLHRVGKDENLHLLSAYYYGDARLWRKIYDVNKKQIRNPNIIHEGQILKVEVPAGWQARFSLAEFMERERKAVATHGLAPQQKPQVIREREEITVIPTLLPLEEEEEAKEEKKGEKEMLFKGGGGVPGIQAPAESPLPPTEGEGGGAPAEGEGGQ